MSMDSQLTKLHPIDWYGVRWEIKRARNGSNKQEALEGIWLVTSVQKMLGEIISPEQSTTKGEWRAFVRRVSQQETTLAFWLTTIMVLEGGSTSSFPRSSSDSLIKRCSAKLSLQSNQTKSKIRAFVTRVSQQETPLAFWLTTIVVLEGGSTSSFPRSSSDSWIFNWKCGRTIASSRRITCLKERTNWVSKPSVTCFGLVT